MERVRFAVILEPVTDPASAGRRLAQVLKPLLRQHGFRCLSVGPAAGQEGERGLVGPNRGSNGHADASAGVGDR